MTSRLAELVERDSDGTLTEAEATELRNLLTDITLCVSALGQRRTALFIAAHQGRSAAMVAKMALAVEADAIDKSPSSALHMAHTAMEHPRASTISWSPWRWAAAALMVILLGGGVAMLSRPAPGFEILAAGGDIFAAGRQVHAGARVTIGDTIDLGEGAHATLRGDDGSRLDLEGGSRLAFCDGPGIILRLERGAISCDIHHQPTDQPMRIIGPRAICTVIGTRLAFAIAADHDRLQVMDGMVRAERPNDHLAVEIASGETVDIANNGSLLPRPTSGGAPADPLHAAKHQGSTLYNPNEIYDVNLPHFPVTYTEVQKLAQHEAGVALVKTVMAAVKGGKTEYRAKPGIYRLPKGADFEMGGSGDFALHLPDCELILESVEDRSLFKFGKAKSFTLTGPLKIDCDPLIESQGRITAADVEKRQFTVEVIKGYHALAPGKRNRESLHTFTPQGVWLPDPFYPEFDWKDAAIAPDGRTITIHMSKDIKRDYWEMLYKVGNLVTVGNAGCGVLFCIWPEQLGTLSIEDMDFYGGGLAWGNATGDSTLRRVRGMRRPGTNRLTGGGGWQSSKSRGRVTFDSCEFRTTNDDILDLASGSMDMIWQQESQRTCVIWTWNGHHYDQDPVGSTFAFYRKDFAPIAKATLAVAPERIPDAQGKQWVDPAAKLIRTKLDFKDFSDGRAFWRLTFDHDIVVDPGTLVEDIATRQMEVVMRNCTWLDCGMRVMVQGGRKIEITNNHFVRIASGLNVCTDAWWWQGETVHDVLIASNVLISSSYGNMWNTGRSAISVHNGNKPIADFPGGYPNDDVVIRDNLILGAASAAIIVQNADRVHITGNDCRDVFSNKDGSAAIAVSGCANLQITDNHISGSPFPAILTEWIDGVDSRGNRANNLGNAVKPIFMMVLDHVRKATAQDNHADKSHLKAVIRVGNSAGVELSGNSASDAPATPVMDDGDGNSDVHANP